MENRGTAATDLQNQPIWVKDLVSWLEKIVAAEDELNGEQLFKQVQEILFELPGQGLPYEFWIEAKGDPEAEQRVVEEDSTRLQKEFEDTVITQAALQQALDAALNIKDEEFQLHALSSVIAQIPSDETQLLEQALDAAQKFENEAFRSSSLSEVVARLPSSAISFLEEALNAALNIKYERYRLPAFESVVAKISPSESRFLQQALDAAQQFKSQHFRSNALSAVTAKIPSSEPQLLQQVLNATLAIKDISDSSKALAVVSAQIPYSERQTVLQKALNAIGKINPYSQSQVLKAAAGQLFPSDEKLQKQALDAALNIKGESFMLEAVAAVAVQIPTDSPLLEIAFQALPKNTNENQLYRELALAAISPPIPPPERKAILKRMLEGIQQYGDLHTRLQLLTKQKIAVQILPSDPKLLQQALADARNIPDLAERAQELASVASKIPLLESQAALNKVLDAAKEIEYEFQQAQVLAAVAPQLLPSNSQLLKQFLDAIEEIEDDYSRTIAMEGVAAVIVQIPTSETHLLQQVIQIAIALENKQDRIIVLSGIAFRASEFLMLQCPRTQISTILEIIPKGKNSADKARLLNALAPRLSAGLFPRALQLIKTEITHPVYQVESIGNLAPYLPSKSLTEALEIVQTHIPGYTYPTNALCHLIPYLSLPQLQQALKITDKRELSTHSDLLTQLLYQAATRLSKPNSLLSRPDNPADSDRLVKRILIKLIKIIRLPLPPERSITTVLTALLPSIKGKCLQSIQDNILLKLQSEFSRAQVIAAIATSPNLTPEQRIPFREQIKDWQQDRPKATALSAFIAITPQLHTEVVALIDAAPRIRKADLALILATRPHPKSENDPALTELKTDQIQALRFIREEPNEIAKANALVQIAPYLLPNQILEAQGIAQDIQDRYQRSRSLLALATRFPEIRDEAKRQIDQVKYKKPEKEESEDKYLILHIELLSQFATVVPEKIPALLQIVEGWSNRNPFDDEGDRRTYKRRRILIALKPHLPLRLVREIERQTSIGKAPQDLWDRALFVLRNEYRQALKTGSLRNDAIQDQDLLNLKEEINALTEMLLMRDLEPPVAVGILGGWGGGKSYIMHLMQTHMVEIRSQGMEAIEAWGLKDDKSASPDGDRVGRFVGHIYQIKFDAWTYAKGNLWASLMQTIFFELDRQVSLEQKLQEALQESGISALDSQSGAIWQALYETSDEDRQWFLENTLNQKALEKWRQNSHIQSDNDQLWDLFATSQAQALNNLKEVESKLKEKQDELKKKQTKILENNTRLALYYTTSQAVITILNKRLGDSFAKDLQEKVIKKLTSATQSTQATRSQAIQWHDSVKADIESVFEQQDSHIDFRFIQKFISKNILVIKKLTSATQSAQAPRSQAIQWHDSVKADIESVFEQQDSHIDFRFIQKFISKNILLILFCLTLVFAAIFLPSNLAQRGFDQLTQVFAGLTPLFGAIPIAQGLFKKGQTLYGEVRLGIVEYKQQLEQSIQRQLDTDRDFRKLNRQVQLLEKEIEAQYAAIPTNIYASIAEFVSNRLQQGGYQDHLGIMHQVKEDLAMLSKRLLPPPASSKKEYIAKIRQLEKVFPRGPARVVIYIDDLDRCSPKTVVEVLEAVQLLVKNPLFIAVLAIDERYINRALAHHYKGVLSLQGSPSSSDYLEKIIQIPYRVRPIAEDALRAYLRAQTVVQDSETSGTKFNEFSPQEFNLLVTCCQEVELSPRSLKRLTNVYKLYKILSRTRGQRPTPREQKAILTLLAFSSRYPDLMRDILANIGSHYEEGRHHKEEDNETLANIFNISLKKYENISKDNPLAQDAKKLRHDVDKLVEKDLKDLKLNEIHDIFTFVRTFSFVGDIGIDITASARGDRSGER